ncbi:MAG: hypothetical protein P1V97_16295, partial [Planctomycetota bacterium]|nr:hypothetical protein [Planctomycetota bacterium]
LKGEQELLFKNLAEHYWVRHSGAVCPYMAIHITQSPQQRDGPVGADPVSALGVGVCHQFVLCPLANVGR